MVGDEVEVRGGDQEEVKGQDGDQADDVLEQGVEQTGDEEFEVRGGDQDEVEVQGGDKKGTKQTISLNNVMNIQKMKSLKY